MPPYISDSGLKTLLQTAKPFYSNGLDNYFLKSGGPAEAVQDFYRTNPVNVRTKDLGGGTVSTFAITKTCPCNIPRFF